MLARGKTKEGRLVEGWYCKLLDDTPIIITGIARTTETHPCYPNISVGQWYEIDPATLAFDTGLKDKNGKPIFGSMGDSRGGDRIRGNHTWMIEDITIGIVKWDKHYLYWVIEHDCTKEFIPLMEMKNPEVLPACDSPEKE